MAVSIYMAPRLCLLAAVFAAFARAELFDSLDTDGSGALDRAEFEPASAALGPALRLATRIPPAVLGAAAPIAPAAMAPLPAAPSAPSAAGAAHAASHNVDDPEVELEGAAFLQGVSHSLVMIIVTELGDKTFFIAAILAMRQSRAVVFGGAIAALALMTVLSAMIGFALPNLLPRKYTHYAGAVLFLYFGCKLLRDASEMKAGVVSDELLEAEEELADEAAKRSPSPANGGNGGVSAGDLEAGDSRGLGNKAARSDGAVLTQVFMLTFVAEWGDRSQIATIAMAVRRRRRPSPSRPCPAVAIAERLTPPPPSLAHTGLKGPVRRHRRRRHRPLPLHRPGRRRRPHARGAHFGEDGGHRGRGHVPALRGARLFVPGRDVVEERGVYSAL